MSDETINVENSPERGRFEISVDGAPAGFTEYLDEPSRRIFFHTVIEEAFAGRGLASTLIQAALTRTRDAGLRVVPICPFVAGFLKKHDEFADIVDPVTPAAIAAVSAAQR